MDPASSCSVRAHLDPRPIEAVPPCSLCNELIALAKGYDLLILECFFPDHLAADGRLTPRPAGEPAAAAEATRLLLIHFYPEVMAVHLTREVRAAFRGKLVIGQDFLVVRA